MACRRQSSVVDGDRALTRANLPPGGCRGGWPPPSSRRARLPYQQGLALCGRTQVKQDQSRRVGSAVYCIGLRFHTPIIAGQSAE